MTRKEEILRMLQKLPDDVSYDRVIYHLDVMKGIEIGLEQMERGEGTEHEEFMNELEAELCPKAKSSGGRRLKKTSGKSNATSPKTPRQRRAPS
jgi:hypothetical protein